MKGSVFKVCGCSAEDLTNAEGKRLACKKRHGSWYYNVPVRDPMTGKTKQVKHGGYRTREEADRARSGLIAEVNAGTWTDDGGMTVSQWLDAWLERKRKAGIRHSTMKVYTQHVDDYLKPRLGSLRLKDLRPGHVSDLLDTLIEQPGSKGATLSANTVTRVHACLRSALSTALKMRLISFNPAKDVELPKATRKAVKPWEPHELGAFLDEAKEHRHGIIFELIAASGVRRGEALGLRWQDVDLATGTITIAQQLTEKSGQSIDCEFCQHVHRGLSFGPAKTEAGQFRRVELDAYTAGLLLQQRLDQDRERNDWSSAYMDHGLVFAREDGVMVRPSALLRSFHSITDAVTVPEDPKRPDSTREPLRRVRIHDLRHGSASLMLAAGVDMNVISKRLGHSRSSFTADTYAHMLSGVGREAAEKAAALIPRRGRSTAS